MNLRRKHTLKIMRYHFMSSTVCYYISLREMRVLFIQDLIIPVA